MKYNDFLTDKLWNVEMHFELWIDCGTIEHNEVLMNMEIGKAIKIHFCSEKFYLKIDESGFF